MIASPFFEVTKNRVCMADAAVDGVADQPTRLYQAWPGTSCW